MGCPGRSWWWLSRAVAVRRRDETLLKKKTEEERKKNAASRGDLISQKAFYLVGENMENLPKNTV